MCWGNKQFELARFAQKKINTKTIAKNIPAAILFLIFDFLFIIYSFSN